MDRHPHIYQPACFFCDCATNHFWCIYSVFTVSSSNFLDFLSWWIFNLAVPNQRADGQRLVNIPMKESFIEVIDSSLSSLGYENRSKFIRDAICEKLQRSVEVDRTLANAPSRVGKGGRKKTRPVDFNSRKVGASGASVIARAAVESRKTH